MLYFYGVIYNHKLDSSFYILLQSFNKTFSLSDNKILFECRKKFKRMICWKISFLLVFLWKIILFHYALVSDKTFHQLPGYVSWYQLCTKLFRSQKLFIMMALRNKLHWNGFNDCSQVSCAFFMYFFQEHQCNLNIFVKMSWIRIVYQNVTHLYLKGFWIIFFLLTLRVFPFRKLIMQNVRAFMDFSMSDS